MGSCSITLTRRSSRKSGANPGESSGRRRSRERRSWRPRRRASRLAASCWPASPRWGLPSRPLPAPRRRPTGTPATGAGGAAQPTTAETTTTPGLTFSSTSPTSCGAVIVSSGAGFGGRSGSPRSSHHPLPPPQVPQPARPPSPTAHRRARGHGPAGVHLLLRVWRCRSECKSGCAALGAGRQGGCKSPDLRWSHCVHRRRATACTDRAHPFRARSGGTSRSTAVWSRQRS